MWDPHFRLDTHEMQQAFFNLCSSLRTFECKAPGCLRCCDGHPCGRRSNSPTCSCSHVSLHHFYSGNTPNTLVLNASEVSCFLESYRDWYQVQALLGACACVCYGTRLSSASLLLRAIV